MANGKQRNDCMIRHIEKDDCSKCDMCCYGELSRIYEMKRDTAMFWSKNFPAFQNYSISNENPNSNTANLKKHR